MEAKTTTPAAALYHRVSTLDQNPALARDELRAAAARLGFAVALEVEETGSGARNDRPGLAKVMDAALRGKIDAVLVWKIDRFGRSVLDLQANLQRLRQARVRFVSTTQGLDLRAEGDAMSKLIFDVLAAVAEWERETIRERTRLGMAHARQHGTRSGKPIGRQRKTFDVEGAQRRLATGEAVLRVARELGISPRTLRREVGAKGSANASA